MVQLRYGIDVGTLFANNMPTQLVHFALTTILLLSNSFTSFALNTSTSSPFIVQPHQSPYLVNEGEPGPILDCAVSHTYAHDTQRYHLTWYKYVNGVPTLITLNDQNFLSKLYELVRNTTDGGYNLRIKKVSFDADNGQFYCSLSESAASAKYDARPATIIVLVRPDAPEIIEQPTIATREGELVRAACQSRHGNPPPKFKWSFSNKTDIPDDWQRVTNASRTDQPTISRIEWRVSPNENGAYLSCHIWNEAMGDESKTQWMETETRRLNVEYRPRVTVGPPHDYNVEEGQKAKLTCTADANPAPAQYMWEHVGGGGERWETADKELIAEKKHSGDYVCTVTNLVGPADARLTLNVLYAPIVKVHPTLNPAEGDDVVLQCDVDANPPAESITWIGPNDTVTKGARLQLNAVNRDAAGNYTCSAVNTLTLFSSRFAPVQRTGQAITIVDIRHKPTIGIITISKTPVLVGDDVTLTCTAEDVGSPPAQYRWELPGKDIDTKSIDTLRISRAQLSDAGQYRCHPWNDVGQGQMGSIVLQVIEPARLTRMLSAEQSLTSGMQSPSLECHAQGHPAPNITWLKDGRVLDGSDGRFRVETTLGSTDCDQSDRCSYPVIGYLRWTDAVHWNDKGVYECQAFNGAGDAHTSDTFVRVIHAPVILNDRYPTDALAAVDIGSTAHITCMVSARPEPTFRWFRNSEEITEDDGSHYAMHLSNDVNATRDEYSSILEVRETTEADMGGYLCRVVNGRGAPAEVVIKLQPKTKPDIPKNLKLFDASYSWLLVGWTPGFDGGDRQNFIFEYRQVQPWTGRSDPNTVVSVQLNHNNLTRQFVADDRHISKRSTPMTNDQVRSFVMYNISDIYPLNTYWFRVKAINSLGETDWTEMTSATTQEAPILADLARPENVVYYPDSKKLVFDPSTSPDDYCLMIYVQMSGEPWRSFICVPSSLPYTDLDPADNMRVRFCRRHAPLFCSETSDVLVASTLIAMPWTIIVPVVLVAVTFLIVFVVVMLCCRFRRNAGSKQKKTKHHTKDYETESTERARPKVSAPLPSGDKNTVVHGSQADSGVFTMGSQLNGVHHQQQQPFHPNGNVYDGRNEPYNGYEEGVDRWGSAADPFDFAADPYAAEFNADYGGGPTSVFYDPYRNGGVARQGGLVEMNPPHQTTNGGGEYDDEDGSFSVANSRRVMREIIV